MTLQRTGKHKVAWLSTYNKYHGSEKVFHRYTFKEPQSFDSCSNQIILFDLHI